MRINFKKFLLLSLFFLAFSCADKKEANPLVIPPNFAEMPDTAKPEAPTAKQKEENIAKLKELLLKSD